MEGVDLGCLTLNSNIQDQRFGQKTHTNIRLKSLKKEVLVLKIFKQEDDCHIPYQIGEKLSSTI